MSIWDHDRDLSPEEAAQRADAVRGMSNSVAFRWLMQEAINTAHQEWENAKTVEAREKAHAQVQAIKALDKEIQKVVDRGASAAKTLRGRERKQSNNNP